MLSEYLTCQQVADELGISISRVHHLIAAGRVPATKFGARAWAIRKEDIEAIRVREGKRGPKAKK